MNNAGALNALGSVGDIDEEQWSTLVSVNLTGTLLSMKHEIAGAVLYLASPESGFVVGTDLLIDGGAAA